MHYRYNGNTSIKYSILIHRDIEVRFGLTKKKCEEHGLGIEDEGHTLEARASIDATAVVRDPEELRAAVERAEQLVGRRAVDRLSSLEEAASELWPD